MGNAENMLAYCEESGEAVKIELLANGIAVRALAAEGSDAALLQRMAALRKRASCLQPAATPCGHSRSSRRRWRRLR